MLLTTIDNISYPLILLASTIAFLSALFISMPIHEFAHAHAAYKEGDSTAKALGRYTLAPFSHIDLRGFIFLLLFGIGFAKPVPIDKRNFKHGKKSEIRVAFAGVLTNLGLGILSCLIYSFINTFFPSFFTNFGFWSLLYDAFFSEMIFLNFMFVFFNLLPIYPLDGFRVVEAMTTPNNGYRVFMYKNSFWIMLVLLLTGILELYISFFSNGLFDILMRAFNGLFGLMV